MKKLLKSYNFTSDQDYYQMVYESKVNGNFSQAKEQFKAMPKENRKDCVKYIFALHDNELNDTTEWFFDLL
jgi:hypothetical protein